MLHTPESGRHRPGAKRLAASTLHPRTTPVFERRLDQQCDDRDKQRNADAGKVGRHAERPIDNEAEDLLRSDRRVKTEPYRQLSARGRPLWR